jgi:hypothetical protein
VDTDSSVFAPTVAALDAVLAWHWFRLLRPEFALQVLAQDGPDGWTDAESEAEARDSLVGALDDAEADAPGRGWALLELIEAEQRERWARVGQRVEEEVPLYVLEEAW